VYTLWDPPGGPTGGWYLDDDLGAAFLDRVRELGPRIACAHKGLAGPIPSLAPAAASPRDIGPAAVAYPDIAFVVYHSGYDIDPGHEEGADDADPSAASAASSPASPTPACRSAPTCGPSSAPPGR
jgi:hypothetical protein